MSSRYVASAKEYASAQPLSSIGLMLRPIRKRLFIRIPCFLAALFISGTGAASAGTGRPYAGIVLDRSDRPVWGATVIVRAAGATIAATPTDSLGRFAVSVPNSLLPDTVIVSAVGFERAVLEIPTAKDPNSLSVILTESTIDVGLINVQGKRDQRYGNQEFTSDQIRQASAGSLVPGNPTAALAAPQLTRVGSSHSSQIRVSGTAPVFYLNGTPIGSDPNHFGAFSVVPGAIVRSMRFMPQGTDVSYGVPSAVNFKTLTPFDTKLSGVLNLSTIEADAFFRIGNTRLFAFGSLRKSTLDKLVKEFDISSDRRTVPPTNFQDVFTSAGMRLSAKYQLLVDQYCVRDFLSYNTAASGPHVRPTQTLQAARESYVGVKLQRVSSRLFVQASASIKNSIRQYVALPQGKSTIGGSRIILNDSSRTLLGRVQSDLDLGHTRARVGVEWSSDTKRTVDLHQQNWNLQPPFACTDNPFIYQVALNKTFGHYSGNTPQDHFAAFASVGHDLGRFSLESGLRYERISAVVQPGNLLQRYQLSFRPSAFSELRLHYGEYVEDPVTTILEPNQPLIRANLSNLTPVRTRLLTADYSLGPVQVGLFRKRISNTPVVSPNYERVYTEDRTVNPDFLGMSSTGRADFKGFSVDLSLSRFVITPLSLHASYALAKATRTEHGITYPYELDSRHRLLTQLDYRASRKFSLGADLQMRTGYPYSPLRKLQLYAEPSNYSEEYLKTVLSKENSKRFPVNATLNFHTRFDFGRVEITLTLTNITNRYNPLISSASGLIYDAGILPSFGLTWKL